METKKSNKRASNSNYDAKLDNHIVQLAQKVLKSKQELKSFDTGFSAAVSTAGTLQKISTIPQGDTDSTRDGDQLNIVRIDLLGSFQFADAINAGRLIIFRWNQDDSSAAPVVADILQTLTPYSPMNRDNLRAKKFSVLHDQLCLVGATGPNISSINLKRFFPSKINFQATATTGNGHIYVYMVSDSGAVTHPQFSYVARVWFTDS
jgi:hypothetical protein